MQNFLKLSAVMAFLAFSVPAMASGPGGFSDFDTSDGLFDSIESGVYAAPVVSYSELAGQGGLFVGARGGWIINHCFVLGGAGYGLATTHEIPGDRLTFGYGGLMLEYIVAPERPFHVSFDTVIGGGAVAPKNSTNPNGVFVLEPEADAIVNLTRSIHAGVGLSYRFTRGVTVANLSSSDLSGFSASFLVQFGNF
jgi:hypothetical protein